MTDSEDSDLVCRARAGEREAFRCLVQRHSRTVHALAYRILGDTGRAEDAVQETFLKAYRQLDQFRAESRWSTWLHRIAVNAAIDLQRREAREPRWLVSAQEGLTRVASPAPDAERLADSDTLARATSRALDALTDLERNAFVLRHFEGWPIARIAAQLDLGTEAAKQAVFRAVRKLRKALSPLVNEYEHIG